MTTPKSEPFEAQEIAYRDARGDWKRRIVRTAKAFVKFTDKLDDLGREWYARAAEW